VVLDAAAIGDLDASGAHLLTELDRDLAQGGVELHLATVRGPVRDVMQRTELWAQMEHRIHPSVGAAIEAIDPGCPLVRHDDSEGMTVVL
jgi:sulfate permease, SulP family